MTKKTDQQGTYLTELSVIIPAYNAALWLPKSVPKIAEEIKRANIQKAEIIIVNDGSTDDTARVAESLKLPYETKTITQSNSGRFIARRAGVQTARYKYVLFIDTRIFIGKNALKHVKQNLDPANDTLIWTSHVVIDKKGNIYARFWEALTFIAWREYFANPRDCSYGIKDFDRYPKGTTCFIAPKNIVVEANKWFENQTKNEKASNDDTLLIRRMARSHNVNLSPKFYCTYHARTSLRQYIRHTYHRGKVFVDGFLRRDGNRFFWPLVAFLILSVIIPISLVFIPEQIILWLVAFLAVWLVELILALLLRVPFKDATSLFLLTPVFVLVYGAGIWKATIDIYVLRNTSG